jgi:hypothetical protein
MTRFLLLAAEAVLTASTVAALCWLLIALAAAGGAL